MSLRKLRRLLLAPALSAVAGGSAAAQVPVERELVEAEQAFAEAASTLGVRAAFLAFADDSALIFRPDPVNARAWWQRQGEVKYRLEWYAALAHGSASGELGFTSGPWQLQDSAGTPRARGSYVTLWRRTPAGWRYLLDVGTEYPQAPLLPPLLPPLIRETPHRGIGPASAATLLALDSTFSARAVAGGLFQAVREFGDQRMWLLLPGRAPAAGLPAALAVAAADSVRSYSGAPLRAMVSSAGDLGWSMGEYRLLHRAAGRRESGYYLRIWSREAGDWRLLLEIHSPGPSERDE